MNLKEITIGIVTKNRSKLLSKCLDSILSQDVKPKSIIIIDNNSTDGTKKVYKKYLRLLPIKYFLEKKEGVGFCRNKVLNIAKTKYLVFIDDDVILEKNWSKSIAQSRLLNKNTIALVGKNISISRIEVIAEYCQFLNDCVVESSKYGFSNLTILDTKNLILNLDLCKKNNLYFLNKKKYGEDIHFANNILAKRFLIKYDPNIVVKHMERNNFISFIVQRLNRYEQFGEIFQNRYISTFFKNPNYEKTANLLFESYLNKTNNPFFLRLIRKIDNFIIKVQLLFFFKKKYSYEFLFFLVNFLYFIPYKLINFFDKKKCTLIFFRNKANFLDLNLILKIRYLFPNEIKVLGFLSINDLTENIFLYFLMKSNYIFKKNCIESEELKKKLNFNNYLYLEFDKFYFYDRRSFDIFTTLFSKYKKKSILLKN